MQIGVAKFDIELLLHHTASTYEQSGRHLQYARNHFDRCMPPPDSFGYDTESDTTQQGTPRGDQERMALRRCGGANSEASNRAPSIARWPLTISSARLAAACIQVWAMIYWMTTNVEKEHNELGCTFCLWILRMRGVLRNAAVGEEM